MGKRAENIERSIAALKESLESVSCDDHLQSWILAKLNLGISYRLRIFGDRSENLEQSIAASNDALNALGTYDDPSLLAKVNNTLGLAYLDRIKGIKERNTKQAIELFKSASIFLDRTYFPSDWAGIQNNLGNAYRDLGRANESKLSGENIKYLEQAIIHYNAALEVRTQCTFPEAWAETQNNLGNAYVERIGGNKIENLNNAIAAFEYSLSVRKCSNFPQLWAETQNNIGIAYVYSSYYVNKSNKLAYMEKAILAFNKSLSIRTSVDFPEKHAETLLNLGQLYYNSGKYDLAETAFKSAITVVEYLRNQIINSEENKTKQSEKWNLLFVLMVETCLALNKPLEAIEYVERSKTRNLVENILNREYKDIFPSEVINQLEDLRNEIASGQYQIQVGDTTEPIVLAQRLQNLRENLNKLQDKYLPVGARFEFDNFQSVLDTGTVIVEWFLTSEKIISFLVFKKTKHGVIPVQNDSEKLEVKVIQSDSHNLKRLTYWSNKYLHDYYENKGHWLSNLSNSLEELADILCINSLLDKIPKNCKSLIFIPYRHLHLFPLHALPYKGKSLLDYFSEGIIYSPSCQIQQQIKLRQPSRIETLFAVQNPTEDLVYAHLEVETLKRLFPQKNINILSGKDATKDNFNDRLGDYSQASCIHFACHGSFNINKPEKSYLALSGSSSIGETDLHKCLTLDDLLSKDFSLNRCRLVVLSACETGLIDFVNTSDEYIGLPSGFLFAGSCNVVSSLWKVNDISTCLLMVKFYEIILNSGKNKAVNIAVAKVQGQNLNERRTLELEGT